MKIKLEIKEKNQIQIIKQPKKRGKIHNNSNQILKKKRKINDKIYLNRFHLWKRVISCQYFNASDSKTPNVTFETVFMFFQ